MLDGSPEELRSLAAVLAGPDDPVVVEVKPQGATVSRRRTGSDRLRVTVDAGPALSIEGTAGAIDIVVGAMKGVADEADEVQMAPIRRHAHIEYLGDDDAWRSPDSFPLVITSDWPAPSSD